MDAGVRATQEQWPECRRKARPRLTDLSGMARVWMPELRQCRSSCPMSGKRQMGCRFLWVTSLLLRASCPPPFGPASLSTSALQARTWTGKREVTRAAQRRESSDPGAARATRPAIGHEHRAQSALLQNRLSVSGRRFLTAASRALARLVTQPKSPPSHQGCTKNARSKADTFSRHGVRRSNPTTPDSSAAQTPPDPATAPQPKSPPAPAAA